MTIPQVFSSSLRLPAIAAPMFLVSGPDLVIAACKAGIIGTFPCLNARPSAQFEEWLEQIKSALIGHLEIDAAAPVGPYGVNLISHKSNGRFREDLEIIVRHRVPLVITSLGYPGEVVEAVHAYGGIVFHDVISAQHARKAIQAGVDGIIAVSSGAGGHAGTQNVISLIREIREFWSGTLVVGGAIGDGFSIRAVEVLGADLAYIGTRFVATQESQAAPEYKRMLLESGVGDIVYTDRISGVNANFLVPSLQRYGIDLGQLLAGEKPGVMEDDIKAWKQVWSAGHGVATIHDVPTVAELVLRLESEYTQACEKPRWGL